MEKFKIVEIGPYPPPSTGWSVRIRHLKEAFEKDGVDCAILNIGKNRKVKSPAYIDVQSGIDYVKKLVLLRLRGYHFHTHMNAQAIKGPVLSLIAAVISLLTGERAAVTFHGGIDQLYFPRKNAGKMYFVMWLNFFLAKLVICNNDPIKNAIADYGLLITKRKIKPIAAFSLQYTTFCKVKMGDEIEEFLSSKAYHIFCYLALRNGFYLDTLLEFMETADPGVGIVITGVGETEDDELIDAKKRLEILVHMGKCKLVDNLDHDQFMTLLERCDLYLRTPVSDGVASSVLEALHLRVPVVASENWRRPDSVITYEADDVEDLKRKISYVFENYSLVKGNIVKPVIKDTVKDEIESLKRVFGNLL